jgi:hypothetical protein
MPTYGQYCPTGRGSRYHLTEAGRDLAAAMKALGTWGGALDGAGPRAPGPGVVLRSWVSWYLARERLPERRVVVRFQFPGLPRKGGELWVAFAWNRRSPAAAVRRTGVPAG